MNLKKRLSAAYKNLVLFASITILVLVILRVFRPIFEIDFVNYDYLPNSMLLSGAFVLPYIISVLGTIATQLEKSPDYWKNLFRNDSGPQIKTLHSQTSLFEDLLEITRCSNKVWTCMFSDPPKLLTDAAQKYFTEVHKEIKKKKGSNFQEFKRIASVGTEAKAEWLLQILSELYGTKNFSLVIKDIDNSSYLVSIHSCKGAHGSSLMLWPTMMADDSGVALLVQDNKAAESWAIKYEEEFKSSTPLKIGKKFYWKNVIQMVEKYKLKNSKYFKELIEKGKKDPNSKSDKHFKGVLSNTPFTEL